MRLQRSEISQGLLSDLRLDIKTCKVGSKNCVNGIVVAIANSQIGGCSDTHSDQE